MTMMNGCCVAATLLKYVRAPSRPACHWPSSFTYRPFGLHCPDDRGQRYEIAFRVLTSMQFCSIITCWAELGDDREMAADERHIEVRRLDDPETGDVPLRFQEGPVGEHRFASPVVNQSGRVKRAEAAGE